MQKNDFLRAETSAWQHTHTHLYNVETPRSFSRWGTVQQASRRRSSDGDRTGAGRPATGFTGPVVVWMMLNGYNGTAYQYRSTHALTHSHTFMRQLLFFLSILLLWFAHFICECVWNCACACGYFVSHTVPQFSLLLLCTENTAKKNSEFWSLRPNIGPLALLIHKHLLTLFCLALSACAASNPIFAFHQMSTSLGPTTLLFRRTFRKTTFGDTLLLAEFTPKCPLNSCNSFSFACECPLGQVKLHPILVSTIEIRELKWTPFPGVVVKGGPGFCQVSFALCQTYSSPSLVNVAN